MSNDQLGEIRNYRHHTIVSANLSLQNEVDKQPKERDEGDLVEIYTQMLYQKVLDGQIDPAAAITCMQLINSSPFIVLFMEDKSVSDYTSDKLIDIAIKSVEFEQKMMEKYPHLNLGFNPGTFESNRKDMIEAVESQSILVVDPNSLIRKFATDTARTVTVEEVFSERPSPVELTSRLYVGTVNNFHASHLIDILSINSLGGKPQYFLNPTEIKPKLEQLKEYHDSLTKFSTP